VDPASSGPAPAEIRVDFQNTDAEGRVRLNTAGTFDDLRDQSVVLSDGLVCRLVDGELWTVGVVRFSATEGLWVAVVDWADVIESGRRGGTA
jgi:hypothetical protein